MLTLRQVVFAVFIITLLACGNHKEKRGVHFNLKGSSSKTLYKPIDLLHFDGTSYLYYSWFQTTDSEQQSYGLVKTDDLYLWKDSLTADFEGNTPLCVFSDTLNESNLVNHESPFIAICLDDKDQGNTGSLTLMISDDGGENWRSHSQGLTFDVSFSEVKDAAIYRYAPNENWVMLINTGANIWFYTSPDLIEWNFSGITGEELPAFKGEVTDVDLIRVPGEDSAGSEWILFLNTTYNVPYGLRGISYHKGYFDGYIFTPDDEEPQWVDFGSDLSAGVFGSRYAGETSRPLFLGLIENRFAPPDCETTATYSLPRQLSLFNKLGNWYLRMRPVSMEALKPGNAKPLKPGQVVSGIVDVSGDFSLPLKLQMTFDLESRKYRDIARVFGVVITDRHQKIYAGYESFKRYFFIGSQKTGNVGNHCSEDIYPALCIFNNPEATFSIVVDHNSVELFGMNGAAVLSKSVSFSGDPLKISLYTEQGKIDLIEGSIAELN